ncbi:trehalose-phosphatase [Microbacterium amylolyticum]|uniref:Trehalose 6-phosphate phosphatase n=1 Tax=Microbacterium amylolyticum TaxID=936337 RepID=A0ABS4ZF27_9MICO|nr:trehalose-phosphatase [Microbacterium amylolyticum]MBP2435884.1 trehalose 6-phosphate phosphatase [Microbacterium amylolyticum]
MSSIPEGFGEAIALLAQAPRLLVALDFDGTLSPLVDEPMTARATPEAKAAVQALVASPQTTVAFVSGRSLADLRVIAEHTDDSQVWLAGSHGAEHWRPAGAAPRLRAMSDGAEREARQAAELATDAEAAVHGVDGAWIEHKAFGFALHTRRAHAEDEATARDAVDTIVAKRAPSWRRRDGKNVVEFAWRHEGKDTAIAELREAVGADAVLFAGDDVTDEDAIRSLEDGDMGIHVGAGETVASYVVDDTPTLAAVLTALARIRST